MDRVPMSVRYRRPLAAAVLVLLARPAVGADAAAESKLRDQLRQTITELRALQDENAALKLKAAAPPPAPTVPPEELKKTQQQAQQARADAKRAEEQGNALRAELDQLKAQLATAQAGLADSQRKLAELGQRAEATSRDAQATQTRFEGCQAKNRQLTGLFDEVLANFSNRGVVDALLTREPLTGLKRAQLERLTDEYRSRAEATAVQ